MKTTGIVATFAFAAALVVAFPGCRTDKTEETQPAAAVSASESESTSESSDSTSASASASAEVTSSGQPVNKNCAVEQEHPIDPKFTYTHDGKVFGFCCEDCIDVFKKDPAKYADAK